MRTLTKLPPHSAVALAILALPTFGASAQQSTQLQTVTITAERREESI